VFSIKLVSVRSTVFLLIPFAYIHCNDTCIVTPGPTVRPGKTPLVFNFYLIFAKARTDHPSGQYGPANDYCYAGTLRQPVAALSRSAEPRVPKFGLTAGIN